ncbi:MAG: exodeoxyribonuclease VII small subunit [Planctomycetota bacterium]|nr:exodeoxyribonuclease VII small subunit [Planctomycetota bacterium]
MSVPPAPESLEMLLEHLDSVVENLERGNEDLEKSLALFEQGMTLVRGCTQRLEAVEMRIQTVTRTSSDGILLESHEHQASHETGDLVPRGR